MSICPNLLRKSKPSLRISGLFSRHEWCWSSSMFCNLDLWQGSVKTLCALACIQLAFFCRSETTGKKASSSSSCSELRPASSIAGGDYSIKPCVNGYTHLATSCYLLQHAHVSFFSCHNDDGHVFIGSTFNGHSSLSQQRLLSCLPRVGVVHLCLAHFWPSVRKSQRQVVSGMN